jgi:predicted alpha/beta-fold hydrolase
MVHLSHSFYLKFFLEKGCNVVTWNYRGYGRSKGSPSPARIRSDIDALLDKIKAMGYTGKIGVYGRSLGGIPSSHLASKVDMAIVDRSFCNFVDMARFKYFGRVASWFFNVGSCGWQVQSDYSISNNQSGYKVIL